MNVFLSKRSARIIYAFISSNLIAFFSIMVLPAKSAEPNMLFLFLLNLTFVNLVLIFAILTYAIYPKQHTKIKRKSIGNSLLNKNINLLSYAPIIGFGLILYDRVIIRGLDYSQGLRVARYAWLDSVGGSFFGILGNLLVPFAYIGVFFLIVYGDRISKKKQYLLIIAIALGIIGHAALNGGRSNILLGVVMAIIAVIFKNKSKTQFFNLTYGKIKLVLVFAISMAYVNHITISSAELGGANMHTLVQLGTESLYGQVDQEYYSSEHSRLLYLLIYAVTYLYHGQWTAQVSHSLLFRDGSYSLPPILISMGAIDTSNEVRYFSDTGAFLSLPGAFYYDFGFLGVIGLSSLLGILLGIVMTLVAYSKSIGGIKMAFIMAILYMLILSPILPAYGLSYFNFIIFSFVLLGFINNIIFRKRIIFFD